MKSRFEVRGPAVGECAICGVYGPLTEDHVPPKGASRLTNVQMADLLPQLQADPKKQRPPKFFQNGVKFKSLCGPCNNVRLGVECDPVLIDFTAEVATTLTHLKGSPLLLPPQLTVRTQPVKVLRSIAGHALAMNGAGKPVGPMNEALAEFFLNPSQPLHRAVDCFYWTYPYNDHVLVQSAVVAHIFGSGGGGVFFKLLKFYPLAFMLTWQRNDEMHRHFQNLADFRNAGLNTELDVAIDTTRPPPQMWPEAPTSWGAVLYAGDPKRVHERKPTGKKRR